MTLLRLASGAARRLHRRGEPSDLIGEPSDLIGEPSDLIGEPSDLIGEPSDLIGGPPDLIGEPSDLIGEPSDLIGDPSDLIGVEDPKKLSEKSIRSLETGFLVLSGTVSYERKNPVSLETPPFQTASKGFQNP
jgi:hypothetical protein